MAITLNQVVAKYVELRDAKDALEKRHKGELRPINEAMKLLEAYMQKTLDAQGQSSASFAGVGTCFKQKWTSAKVRDWEAALPWIIENERWDLLTQAVSKNAVIDEMTKMNPETGEITMVPCPIPGIEVDSGYKVQVRRS